MFLTIALSLLTLISQTEPITDTQTDVYVTACQIILDRSTTQKGFEDEVSTASTTGHLTPSQDAEFKSTCRAYLTGRAIQLQYDHDHILKT